MEGDGRDSRDGQAGRSVAMPTPLLTYVGHVTAEHGKGTWTGHARTPRPSLGGIQDGPPLASK